MFSDKIHTEMPCESNGPVFFGGVQVGGCYTEVGCHGRFDI